MLERADVVIVGSGILGSATAYYLAKFGMSNIAVLEKNTICCGATGACGAGIRAQWGTEMNCRLGIAALDMFEQLDEELGLPTGLNQKGYLLVAYKEAEWENLKRGVVLQNSLGVKSKIITLKEAREIIPKLAAEDAIGFTYHARDGHADPFLTTFAYVEAGKRLGVTYHKKTEVTGILLDNGAVKGVKTAKGDIHAPIVINCAGAEAQFIAKMAGSIYQTGANVMK